jgi:hypothetical protein
MLQVLSDCKQEALSWLNQALKTKHARPKLYRSVIAGNWPADMLLKMRFRLLTQKKWTPEDAKAMLMPTEKKDEKDQELAIKEILTTAHEWIEQSLQQNEHSFFFYQFYDETCGNKKRWMLFERAGIRFQQICASSLEFVVPPALVLTFED